MLAPKTAQTDFSAGACPSFARNLIPENGLYGLQNGLLNLDGGVYKRGGSKVLSTAGFGAAGLTWIWHGYFPAGHRTLFANPSDFGVLDGSDAPINLGGSGLAEPATYAYLGGLLFIGGGTIYAGSLKANPYSTGTVDLTNGSAVVTGSGTSWSANVDAGMIFRHGSERVYVVKSVDSDGQITLTEPYQGATDTGEAYTLKALETASAPYRSSSLYAVAGQKLISCENEKFYMSKLDDPHTWDADDNWALPGGVRIIGASGIENRLLLLTTAGLWQASNIEYDLTDEYGNPQHNVRQVTEDINLWHPASMATFAGDLIVPGTDGVWMVSERSYDKISRSIDSRYSRHIADGCKPGQGHVYNSHFLLPIIDGSGEVREVLTCRLDRPTRARGQVIYPWGWLTGSGANVYGFASRTVTSAVDKEKLIAAGAQASSRVLDCSGYFTPKAAVKYDHDNTTPRMVLETRDFPTGRMNKALVKAVELSYRLIDAATDNPTISGSWSDGQAQESGSFWGIDMWGVGTWTSDVGSEFTDLLGVAPEDDGRKPKFWRLRFGRARTEYVRFRFRTNGPSHECLIRSLEIFFRANRRL